VITKRKESDQTGQKASIRQLALLPGQGKSIVALALTGTAAGTLGLTVDTGETVSSVSIALDDLTIPQAAQAIAERLTADGVAASVSDTPLLPDLVFDGEEPADTEIQIFGLPDPAITIDLRKTALDVQFSEDLDVVSLEDFVDKSFQKKELTEIAESPISVFRGVSKADADRLRQAFNVKTVRDLANLKFVDWARKIVDRE
jgi:hypothetical protein